MLMIADLTRDVELASFAFERSHHSSRESMVQKLRRLVYETCFGDREQAQHVATEILANLPLYGQPNAPRLVGILYDVGYAYYRIGDELLARQCLTQALEVAVHNEMIGAQIHTLNGLALLSWSTGRIDECRHWHHELRQFESHDAFGTAGCEYYIVGARLAIDDGQFAEAAMLIERGRRLPQACLDSPRMLLLACEIRKRFAEDGGSCSRSEFAELMTFHTRARHLGEQDEIALILLNELITCGERLEAERLLNDYLLRRREGFEIRGPLRQLSAQLQPRS